jgi:hypothetical protein
VLGHVGQRLLHDPEGCQIDGAGKIGQMADLGIELDADVDAGGPRPLDQVVEALQAGHRRPGGCARGIGRRGGLARLVDLAQHAEDRAQLDQGLLAGLLDRGQRLAGLLGPLVEQVERHPGLDADQRHVVGHHVMELAGDPHPLVGGLAAQGLGVGPGGGLGPVAAAPHHLGHAHQRDQPRGEGHEGPERRPLRAPDPVAHPRERQVPRHDAGDGEPAAAGQHEVAEHDDQREEDRAAGVAERPVGQRRPEHHHVRPHREPVPERQRRHAEQEQRHAGHAVVALGSVGVGRPGEADVHDRHEPDQQGFVPPAPAAGCAREEGTEQGDVSRRGRDGRVGHRPPSVRNDRGQDIRPAGDRRVLPRE